MFIILKIDENADLEQNDERLCCVLCCVQVFGKTAVDVLLSQGVLAVSHSSNLVRLYSFEYIVNKVMAYYVYII